MALLSAKPIINWCNVNMYSFGNQWVVQNGDSLQLYFQIIDTDQAQINNQTIAGQTFFGNIFSGITAVGTVAGLRYLVGIGTSNQPYSVQVTFPSIDLNGTVTLNATQA